MLEQSEEHPLAYIETDYFGGVGEQNAVVAVEGRVVIGPESGSNVINKALQVIGVRRLSPALDEFDALGLDCLLDNDDADVPS